MSAPLNYSTKVPVTRTLGEMADLLVKHNASRVATDYTDGEPSGLTFFLVTPHGPRVFSVPVDVTAMHRLLTTADTRGELRTGLAGKRATRDQAARVAWRVVKDWLEAQLALVECQQARLDQTMLPYLHVDDSGRTLYDAYRDNEARAIETGGA